MAIKLMIAEDEEIERRAFRLMLGKNLPEIDVTEDAVNGLDLVEKAMQVRPDIIVVDVEMPGINGLDAVKMLRQKGLKSKIIMHTAYNRFEYAQEALSSGADGYILKPIKKEKITNMIKQYVEEIKQERIREEEREHLAQKIEEISPIIAHDFMASICIGEIDESNLEVYLDILDIHFSQGFVITVHIPSKELTQYKNKVEKNEVKMKIVATIKSEAEQICSCIVGPLMNDCVSIFVSVNKDMGIYETKVWSIEIGDFIAQKVCNLFDFRCGIGIGQLCKSINMLPKSYRESKSALYDRSVRSSIKHFGDVFGEAQNENQFRDYKSNIVKYINTDERNKIDELIDTMFEDIWPSSDLNRLKDMLVEFMVTLTRNIYNTKVQADHGWRRVSYGVKEIGGLTSLDEMKQWMKKTVGSIASEVNADKKHMINTHVESAIDLIKSSFSENISLEGIAEQIGVSPYYLSRLFKQEVQENFIDYLTKIRVEHAIRLIKEKNYTIRELSEKVGYSNPTYFCKVFKKIVGKTVGELREGYK